MSDAVPPVRNYGGYFNQAMETLVSGRTMRVYGIADLTVLAQEYVREAGGNPTELARAFIRIKHMVEEFEESLKGLNALFEAIKTGKLPQLFADHKTKSVNVDVDGVNYRVTAVKERLYASIKGDKKMEAYEWLRKNGLDALIVETVNASTLSASAGSMLEEKNKELDPDLFNIALVANTSVTQVK